MGATTVVKSILMCYSGLVDMVTFHFIIMWSARMLEWLVDPPNPRDSAFLPTNPTSCILTAYGTLTIRRTTG